MQNIVWITLTAEVLEMEGMSKSHVGMEIRKSYERLCLRFYPLGSLFFLVK